MVGIFKVKNFLLLILLVIGKIFLFYLNKIEEILDIKLLSCDF